MYTLQRLLQKHFLSDSGLLSLNSTKKKTYFVSDDSIWPPITVAHMNERFIVDLIEVFV